MTLELYFYDVNYELYYDVYGYTNYETMEFEIYYYWASLYAVYYEYMEEVLGYGKDSVTIPQCICGTPINSLYGCYPNTGEVFCKTADATDVYNCWSWSVGRDDKWTQPTHSEYPPPARFIIIDYHYGNGDRFASESEWDAFYADHGMSPSSSSGAKAGWNSDHGYNLASCAPHWESKCGDGIRATHGERWHCGYGEPKRYYK